MRLILVASLLFGGCLSDSVGSTTDTVAPETTADTQVATEVAPDTIEEVAAETIDEVAPETIEETIEEVAPETVEDVVTEVGPETTTEVVEEVVEPDPCDPNPCTKPPDAFCDGNDVVAYPAVGACEAKNGHATCSYDSTTSACGNGFVCDLAECLPVGDPCERAFSGTISYVYELHLGNQERDEAVDLLLDPCCVDFTGDGQIDNKLGTLIETLSGFIDERPNDILRDEIVSGDRVILLESVGLDSIANDPDFVMYGLDARDTDNNYQNNASGHGTFEVSGYTFVPGTAIPRTRMPASISDHTLTTHDATFWLERLPFIGLPINLQIERVSLTAVTSEAPEGLALDGTLVNPETQQTFGAELGGVLRIRALYDGMNELAADCPCMTFGGDGKLIAITDGGDAFCRPVQSDNCGGNDVCNGLVDYCETILAVLSPDVDMNDDGNLTAGHDGMSIGFFLKATSASVVGVSGCE